MLLINVQKSTGNHKFNARREVRIVCSCGHLLCVQTMPRLSQHCGVHEYHLHASVISYLREKLCCQWEEIIVRICFF